MNIENQSIDAEKPINETAVSLYGQADALDDFPVLKAFQQYIDSEQTKARKRMLVLCIFFGCLMFFVVAVFVALLMNVSSRNQALNDRLIEFAMHEKQHPGSSVVVQQPFQQDNSAILEMTKKLEALQQKIEKDQAEAEKASREAIERARQEAIDAARPKPPSPQELEIQRLKAIIKSDREKLSAEKERKRQEELEEYRRKHYPEYYAEQEAPLKPISYEKPRRRPAAIEKEVDEIDALFDDDDAIQYFDETPRRPPSRPQKQYSIPVDIKGSSSAWEIPEED